MNKILNNYKESLLDLNKSQREYLNEIKENNSNIIKINKLNNDTNNEILRLKERINILQHELQTIYKKKKIDELKKKIL